MRGVGGVADLVHADSGNVAQPGNGHRINLLNVSPPAPAPASDRSRCPG